MALTLAQALAGITSSAADVDTCSGAKGCQNEQLRRRDSSKVSQSLMGFVLRLDVIAVVTVLWVVLLPILMPIHLLR